MKIIQRLTKILIKSSIAAGIGMGLLSMIPAQAAIVYVNPTSCQYYPTYHYIKCYYPNHTSKTYYATNTYKRCDQHGICYWVRCFDYPFYHACYKYSPNRVY